MLLKVPGLQQRADDYCVTKDHHQKWETEAHADLNGEHQDLCPIVFVVPVDQSAERLVMKVGLDLGKDELREGQQDGDKPNPHTHQFAVEQPLFLQVLGLGNLHNSNIAIHTYACKQKHAAEEVDFVEGRHHFAQTHTKGPALYGIDSPDGQCAQEEEVGHRQVQQVHVRHCLQALPHPGVDPNNQQVANSTHQEDHAKEGRLIVPTKQPGWTPVAHGAAVILARARIIIFNGFLHSQNDRGK